jgi:hypothetical protein
MINLKKTIRTSRLLRLYVLSEAYYRYQMFYLSESLLKHKTDYKTAENTSFLINSIFNGETTPADFIKSQDETINEVIEKYNEYNNFLNETLLDKEVIDAFCRAAEHNSRTLLKTNSVGFQNQIEALIRYNTKEVTKEQIQNALVDYCIFTKKTKKMNFTLFKKTVYSIEKLYTEILEKKVNRKKKKN